MAEKVRIRARLKSDLRKVVERATGSLGVRLIELLTSVSVVTALGGLLWQGVTNYYPTADQQRAWEVLDKYRGEKGDYGRRLALTVLNAGCGSWVPSIIPFAPVCHDLRDVWLPHATLYNPNLNNAVMARASFFNAFLDGADFQGTDLREACFQKATLRGVIFRGADLRNADLRDVVVDDRTSFRGARLCYTLFSQHYFPGHPGHVPGFPFDGNRDCPTHPIMEFDKTVCDRTARRFPG